MSDAATATEPADSEDPEPNTWTEDGDELEMIRGDAYNRTDDPVVFVDARCIGCQNVTVCNAPADAANWKQKSTFADDCGHCSMLTPHNILSLLTGLNRSKNRGRVQRGDDADGQ